MTSERGDIPLKAVLMIDSRSSMYGPKIEAARAGATTFIIRLADAGGRPLANAQGQGG